MISSTMLVSSLAQPVRQRKDDYPKYDVDWPFREAPIERHPFEQVNYKKSCTKYDYNNTKVTKNHPVPV